MHVNFTCINKLNLLGQCVMCKWKSWTSTTLYVYMQPFLYWFYFFCIRIFCAHMHIKIIQQWESTLTHEEQVDFKTKLSSPCHPFFSLFPTPPPPKKIYLTLRLNSLLWSVSQEPLMSCHSCRNRVSPQVLHLHQLLPFYWSFLWCLLWLKNIYTCKTECIVEDVILSQHCKVHSCSHSNRDDQCCY